MATTTIPGKHRTWTITPREGTGPDDHYTVIGQPIPNYGSNPAATIEDGQFSTWQHALKALNEAERIDNGEHEE